MKHILAVLLLPFLAVLLVSFDQLSLLYRPMPVLPNKTLDGKVIDTNYYKGHVTVVSFMYIGCLPCMYEISALNKIKKHYGNNTQVQVLCVARQMRQQMIDFNGNSSTLLGKVRHAIGVDSITYTIQPGCSDTVSKMIKSMTTESVEDVHLKSECVTLEETFGIGSYPDIYYVDKKGIIRDIHVGGPGTNDSKEFYDDIKKNIDQLLAE